MWHRVGAWHLWVTLYLPFIGNIVLEALARSSTQENGIKGLVLRGKGAGLCANDVTLYLGIPKESSEGTELTSGSCKMREEKQNQLDFCLLQMNNWK